MISNLSKLFKDDSGKPFVLSKGQADIFEIIVKRKNPRNNIICPTQYGKSVSTALGVIIRFIIYGDKIAIIAPQEKKAKIIMNYIIDHIFDNPIFYSQLEIDEPLERLRRERSKNRLTSKRGGEVFVATADARNRQRVKESLMGFGADMIIEDEAALIPDDLHSTVMRMLGGHQDNFLLKITNPWNRGHFFRSWHNPKYHNVFIDYHQAIDEGRFTKEFIDEMKQEAFFDVMYGCKFPEADEIDERGYHRLLTDIDVENAQQEKIDIIGKLKLGVDIGRGGNATVFVLRGDNGAKILEKNQVKDLMNTVSRIKNFKEEYKIDNSQIYVDDVGVGGGVSDRLMEQDIMITAVKEGAKASENEKFINCKAENFWELRNWIKDGGKLEKSEDWLQLIEIKYKEDSASRLKIESKEDMVKRGVSSPDVADALMLTFNKTLAPDIVIL